MPVIHCTVCIQLIKRIPKHLTLKFNLGGFFANYKTANIGVHQRFALCGQINAMEIIHERLSDQIQVFACLCIGLSNRVKQVRSNMTLYFEVLLCYIFLLNNYPTTYSQIRIPFYSYILYWNTERHKTLDHDVPAKDLVSHHMFYGSICHLKMQSAFIVLLWLNKL